MGEMKPFASIYMLERSLLHHSMCGKRSIFQHLMCGRKIIPGAGKESYCTIPGAERGADFIILCVGKEAFCPAPYAGKEAYCTIQCAVNGTYCNIQCTGKKKSIALFHMRQKIQCNIYMQEKKPVAQLMSLLHH